MTDVEIICGPSNTGTFKILLKLKSVISDYGYFSCLIHLLYFVASGMPGCVDLTALHVDFALCKQGNERLMVSFLTSTCICCFYLT